MSDEVPEEFKAMLALNPHRLYWDRVLQALVTRIPDFRDVPVNANRFEDDLEFDGRGRAAKRGTL